MPQLVALVTFEDYMITYFKVINLTGGIRNGRFC